MAAHSVETKRGGAGGTAGTLGGRHDPGRHDSGRAGRVSSRVRPGRSATHNGTSLSRPRGVAAPAAAQAAADQAATELAATELAATELAATGPAEGIDPKSDIAGCYAAHSPIVQRYVSRICGNEHSHDVTQDVFTAFWNSSAAFDPDRGSVQSLLLTIGHRRAIDVSRQNTSRAWRDHRYAAHAPAAAFDDVDADMLRGELIDQVSSALNQLRPELRDPIQMAFFEDCTYQEVASRLGLPEGTVKSRIRSGFGQLRTLLGQYAA